MVGGSSVTSSRRSHLDPNSEVEGIYMCTHKVHALWFPLYSRPANPESPRRQEMIPPLHDTTEPEAAPAQAQPLRPQGGNEDQTKQAGAGGEEVDGRRRRVAANGGRRGGEPRYGIGRGDLERGGAVVELVVKHLGVGAGDLEVAEGVGVQAVNAGGARCYLACANESKLASLQLKDREGTGKARKGATHSHRPC